MNLDNKNTSRLSVPQILFWTQRARIARNFRYTTAGQQSVIAIQRPSEDLYLEFSHGKFTTALAADIWHQYANCIMGCHMQENSMAANPHLVLKYTFGPRFCIPAHARYNLRKINKQQQIYDRLIMLNYKYLT